MKYTQKDVCRLLNITRETLRTYEKLGILKNGHFFDYSFFRYRTSHA